MRPGSPEGSGLTPVAAAMLEPDFYGDGAAEVRLLETHVSWVYLAGDRAYKLRKPVVFPFLDYGTAERRREMSEEEVRLGRRLAPDLYLAVRPVLWEGDRYALGPPGGSGVEHVVEMRRFDESRTLAALLGRGAAGPDEARRVARRVAAFHAESPTAPEGVFGAEDVAATVSENFGTLLPWAAEVGPAELAAGHRFAAAFLHGRRELLERRAREGHVRECHGDLRAEHVILEDGVEVFDPVEFDPGLRTIDVAADLAFLAMELADAGGDGLARELAEGYRAAGGDDGGDSLLGFYAAYRAWVRAKVACLRAGELEPGREREEALERARGLAAHGRRLAWRARRPLVLAVCGVSASGKSVLADRLAGLSGLPVLGSDAVRKELAGLAPSERAPPGAYAEDESLRTYRELGARAAGAAAGGAGGAVVDATFRRRSHRLAFAEGYGAPPRSRTGGHAAVPEPLFVECHAPAPVLAERARAREREPDRVSDATPAIVERQLGEREPLDEVPAERHVQLRTDRPPEALVEALEAALDALLATGAAS